MNDSPGKYGIQAPEDDEYNETHPYDEDNGEDGPAYDESVVVRADAKNRSLRTLAQGAVATAVVAVIIAIAEFIRMAAIGPENVFNADTWTGVGGAALVAALTALASYVQRRVEH